jgi:hypothetical protein
MNMGWSRQKSTIEEMMIAVLVNEKRPMSILEISCAIKKLDPSIFNGKTPKNSLYSIIYRREKKRKDSGEKGLFKTIKERRDVLYILNL